MTTLKPWRIIRGEKAGFQSHYFRTKDERQQEAARYAELDQESVLTEVWSPEHPQDELNEGWGCDGVVYPPGQEPPPDPRPRIPAGQIKIGQNVEVWAFPDSTMRHPATDVSGTVAKVEQVKGYLTQLITFTDGRQAWAVESAVTKINEEV